jgi:cell division septation protein DedD
MGKKILGSLGVVAGLGALLYLGFHFLAGSGPVKAPASSPPGAFQGVIAPASQPPSKAEPTPALPAFPPEPAPAATEPATPPALAPPPPPAPAPMEKTTATPAPVETQAEPALLVRKFRRYADAKRLLVKIQKRQIPALIRQEGKYYKVWAGPFPTPKEASRARKNIRTALRITSRPEKLEVPVPK